MGSAVSIRPLVQDRRVLRSVESCHQPRQPYWHRSDDVGLMYIHYDEPGGAPPPPERCGGRRSSSVGGSWQSAWRLGTVPPRVRVLTTTTNINIFKHLVSGT